MSEPAPDSAPTTPVTPAVSVVLIVFNDEGRLPRAIRSARMQTLTDIEIIIVDHGSTDGSVAVAEAAAAEDPRIRVIALGDNEGKPGRPINAGMQAARAPWVTVFASDDILRRKACERMLQIAQETQADIVIGSLLRVNMDTKETTRWMPSVSLRSRVVTDIRQFPEVIRDTTGGGKLYNTDFIRRHGLSFPEDIFYQDQVFTIRYFAAAHRIAITSAFVLDWRHWPGGDRPSVTQRRTTPENLADRFRANELIDEYLRAHDREDLLVLKQRKFLTHDLSVHVKDLDEASPEYLSLLVRRTREYTADFAPEAYEGLPLNKWLMVRCLLAGRPSDAEAASTSYHTAMLAVWPRARVGAAEVLVPPWTDGTPDPVFDVTRYRLGDIPDRFQPARGSAAVSGGGGKLEVAVTLESHGRADASAKRAGELMFLDPESGARWYASMPAPAHTEPGRRHWRFTVRTRGTDKALGTEGQPVEVHAVFHRGAEGQWSLRLRPAPDHEDSATADADWFCRSEDNELTVVRRPPNGLRQKVERRLAPDRPEPEPEPDPLEEFTTEQVQEFLAETDIEPRADNVFLEAFEGRRVAEGPLVVSRALAAAHPRVTQHWSCTPWSLPDVPTGARPARRLTRGYAEALARSAVWIDNGWLPFDPGPRRRLVQLWHGTPITRLDPPKTLPGWTDLVTSGDYQQACLAHVAPPGIRALPSGAPRTDPLLAPDAAQRRNRLREAWGVADRTVVLYCPIIREGSVPPEYRRPHLHALAAALGDGYFWFHREHDDEVAGRRLGVLPDDLRWFTTTVSSRLELTDYLLAADVLVSDYSSVQVDFAITGKPVIHYAPDQEFYEQIDPGTYVRLADRSAGPVVTDDTELVAAIRTVTADPAAYDSRHYAEALAPLDLQVSAQWLLAELGL